MAAQNPVGCLGTNIPNIPNSPNTNLRIDIEWEITNDFPGSDSLFEQTSKPDENSSRVYLKFEKPEEVNDELLKTYNYQKNLSIKDPSSNIKIENVNIEMTF